MSSLQEQEVPIYNAKPILFSCLKIPNLKFKRWNHGPTERCVCESSLSKHSTFEEWSFML